jgi:hypothetical protein
MITVQLHLYGKLRKYTDNENPRKESLMEIQVKEGTSIREILEKKGISINEVGSNIFLNGEYSSIDRPVQTDSRLGVFPDDMNLLYKWHFEKKEK